MAKTVAFYYTQSGQGLDILKSVVSPLQASGNEVVMKEISPQTKFPFPWTAESFFQAFPESRLGLGCGIETPDLSGVEDASLVIIVYPVWFLSPAIPLAGFFQNEDVQRFLKDKSVITVSGVRNMQVMAHKTVKKYLSDCGAHLVGNICLQDRHHNLVSVFTIVRWLLGGKKEKSGILPAAGVSPEDIAHASVFGEIISERISSGADFTSIQDEFLANGAVIYKPHIAFVERTGHRMFGIWAKAILKKGPYNSPKRSLLLKIFMYYLFAVIYLISPIGLGIYFLCYPFRLRTIQREKDEHCRL
ncbi:MAG: hypothetical protein LBR64_10060 [Dysgonamonadaceae bacterium]|jgi:hypothetical protein|nr:hypothetical protein [Dysgonamonadaceae bacterium]